MDKKYLKQLVDQSALLQGDIAEQAQISGPYLSKLLNNTDVTPSIDVIDRLAGVLGVTVDFILHGAREVNVVDVIPSLKAVLDEWVESLH